MGCQGGLCGRNLYCDLGGAREGGVVPKCMLKGFFVCTVVGTFAPKPKGVLTLGAIAGCKCGGNHSLFFNVFTKCCMIRVVYTLFICNIDTFVPGVLNVVGCVNTTCVL